MREFGKQKDTVLIVYHEHCTDGFTSAWIVNSWVKRRLMADVELLACSYTSEDYDTLEKTVAKMPVNFYKYIYIVDFSVPMFTLESIAKRSLGVVVLDHHKTAFEKYGYNMEMFTETSKLEVVPIDNVRIHLDNSKSGASLCWEYFNGAESYVPHLVSIVEDHDLWQFKYMETKPIIAFLKDAIPTFKMWSTIDRWIADDSGSYRALLRAGNILLSDHRERVNSVSAWTTPVTMCGLEGVFAICPGELVSDVGNVLATEHGTFALMCTRHPDEELVKFSLRANAASGVDVSEIAKAYGGGGHKFAAGFTLNAIEANALMDISKITFNYNSDSGLEA